MAFIEGVIAIVAKEISQAVVSEISAEIKKVIGEAMFRTEVFAKYDKQAEELYQEGLSATTIEEKDAILEKIYNARPKFT